MLFQEAVSNAMSGRKIRRACWIDGIWLRWNWSVGWQVITNDTPTWEFCALHPHPLDILASADDWEDGEL